MKKLSTEQKAERYDEVVSKLKSFMAQGVDPLITRADVQDFFPELCESEDERIRKEFCKDIWTFIPNEKAHKYIAWLEKQGEQDNNEDSNILQRFSFYSYKDEPNILYLSGLYVNEECRNKGIGTKILEVADEVAKSLNCHAIRLKTKKDSNAERLYRIHGYNGLTIEASDEIWLEKQGEQKSIEWHREDEQNLNACLGYIPDEFLRRWLKDVVHVKYDKPTDKVEPKFKVGDWLQYRNAKPFLVEEITQQGYVNGTSCLPFEWENEIHLWSIQDAKDGDILCTYECCEPKIVFILKGMPKKHYALSYYCYYNIMYPHFKSDSEKGCLAPNDEDVKPATKQQCDTLMKAMTNAGYIFDFDKKELKKIEPKQEWSKEDEKIYQSIMDDTVQENQLDDKQTNWLRNIKERNFARPQSTWKPSNEQLHYLSWIANIWLGDSVVEQEVSKHLNELYEDLKKLREG